MTDFTNVGIVVSVEYIIFDDYTLFVSGIMHVTSFVRRMVIPTFFV